MQAADDTLGRALYALEAAWPPGFDPSSGNASLDVGVQENRALFIALSRHLQVCGMNDRD